MRDAPWHAAVAAGLAVAQVVSAEAALRVLRSPAPAGNRAAQP
jgi:uncharacterized membrane protein